MNLFDSFAVAETDYRRVTAERLSHPPKDGALAQQPKADRAPHSAVERPQAAGKSRSTSPTVSWCVCFHCCRRIGVRHGYLVNEGSRAEFGREGRARPSLRRGAP